MIVSALINSITFAPDTVEEHDGVLWVDFGYSKTDQPEYKVDVCTCGCGMPILACYTNKGSRLSVMFEPDELRAMFALMCERGYGALVIPPCLECASSTNTSPPKHP